MKVNRPTTPNVAAPKPADQKSATSAAATTGATGTTGGWAAKGAAAPRAALKTPVSTPAATTSAPVAAPSAFRTGVLDTTLDAQTNSRAVAGNKVTMLFDGVNSFAERNKMIDGAKESICLQTFIFNSDDTGWDLARKLAAKAKEGVDVRVIYDAVGSNRADPKMFDMMREAGVDVKVHAPLYEVTELNNRWHEKHLIVDGKASVEGGMNIANEYALGGSGQMVFSRGKTGTEAWRDTDVKTEGPGAGEAMKAFARNWDMVGGKLTDADKAKLFPKIAPQPGGSTVRLVQTNPEVKSLDGNTNRLYLEAIKTAQKSITIENAYFLPPKELREAILDARKRGVEVNVMTNSHESNDNGMVADASRYFYDDMIKAGVKIYEKQGGTLHAKTATFDGQFSIVGSVNLNGRSHNQDSEDAMAITSEDTAKQLQERFSSGLEKTKPVTMDELQHESFATNLRQWAFSTLAWTF